MSTLHRILRLAARGERTAAQRDELRRLHAETDPHDLQMCARDNRVEHVVGSGLIEEGLIAENSHWSRILAENAAGKKTLFEALSTVMGDLQNRGIRCAMIESAAVAARSGMPLRALGSGDADVIVARGRLLDTLQVFAAHGFHPAPRDGRIETSRVELCTEAVPPIRAEVGERAFDRHWTPLPFASREREWLERASTCAAWPALWTPCTEDLLVQVATHTSMHSFVRAPGLRLHVDVDRMVRHCTIDWSMVVRETRSLHAATRVWLSLTMAMRLLDTPIPQEALDALRPPAIRANALRWLLERQSVFEDGRPKLPPAQALILDILLEDAAPMSWLSRNVLPTRDWLDEHFGGDGHNESRLQLQLRRLSTAATRWKPR